MSKQQTAVEWLVNELKPHIKTDWPLFRSIRSKIEQAKAMEKEQIIEAHGNKYKGGFRNDGNFFEEKVTGEQYYNEIYES